MEVKIRLSSTDVKKLTEICSHIKEIGSKTGVEVKGPIPLPTKRLKIPIRTSPCGQGRELYEIWEKRIHRRLFKIVADERVLRYIMRIPIPKEVHIEMEILE